MKVSLRDDGCGCGVASHHAVGVALDDDCPSEVLPPGIWPGSLAIMARTRTGFDDDGNPLFDWQTLLDGPVISIDERTEWDPISGLTVVVTEATMSAGELEVVPETSMAVAPDGTKWRISGAVVSGGGVKLKMIRLEQDG